MIVSPRWTSRGGGAVDRAHFRPRAPAFAPAICVGPRRARRFVDVNDVPPARLLEDVGRPSSRSLVDRNRAGRSAVAIVTVALWDLGLEHHAVACGESVSPLRPIWWVSGVWLACKHAFVDQAHLVMRARNSRAGSGPLSVFLSGLFDRSGSTSGHVLGPAAEGGGASCLGLPRAEPRPERSPRGPPGKNPLVCALKAAGQAPRSPAPAGGGRAGRLRLGTHGQGRRAHRTVAAPDSSRARFQVLTSRADDPAPAERPSWPK